MHTRTIHRPDGKISGRQEERRAGWVSRPRFQTEAPRRMPERIPGLSGERTAFVMALFLVVLGFSGCNHKETSSFSRDILPILSTKCASCHFGGRTPYDFKLQSARQDLIDKRYVLKFNSAGSPMFTKIKGGHPALHPLSPKQINLFGQWINEGAQNN